MEKFNKNIDVSNEVIIPPVNWNKVPDMEKSIWERLTGNFWLDTRIPLASDLDSWATMSPDEKLATNKVFGGLTSLDTLQGEVGANSLIINDPDDPHYNPFTNAIYNNISFMESLTGDTMLLTPSGWRYITEIHDGDVVAQYDPDSHSYSFVKCKTVPATTHEYLYEITGNYSRQVTSPNHRVFWLSDGEKRTGSPAELQAELERGDAHIRLVTSAKWAGDYPEHLSDHSGLLAAANTLTGSLPDSSELPSDYEEVRVRRIPGDDIPTYCVQVPSTYILTLNSGDSEKPAIPVVTGNCVHAKSYSSIFSTLLSTEEINATFDWAINNEFIKRKQAIMMHYYRGADYLQRHIASVMLESFLFYSGFFWPLYLSAHSKLTNTADIISLILRDEAIHGYYIGYRLQTLMEELPPKKREEYHQFALDLMLDLYDNELKYTEEIYDKLGLTEQVKSFLRYNANKALQNLGFEEYFTPEETHVLPEVLSSLSPDGSSTNFDFFSNTGAAYVIAKADELDDDDFGF